MAALGTSLMSVWLMNIRRLRGGGSNFKLILLKSQHMVSNCEEMHNLFSEMNNNLGSVSEVTCWGSCLPTLFMSNTQLIQVRAGTKDIRNNG